MLPLFLMFLAVAGIHSLPLQENCTETETKFHDCLRKLYPELILSTAMEGYESQKAAFIQCGAKHSDCYLQTSLMTMLDSLIQELKDGLVDDKGEPTHNYTKFETCYYKIPKEIKVECLKQTSFNEHGFRLTLREVIVEIIKYMIKNSDLVQCVKETIDEWNEVVGITINFVYREKMSNFWLFVAMNAVMDKEKPTILPDKFIQPPHCKESEKKFKDCVQEKTFLPSDYRTRRDAFVQCGAKESDCYLQQHLMKMIDTINDTVVGFDDIEIEGPGCPNEPDNIRLECLRPGFDEHGFPKPDREFDYYNDHCKAEHWQRVGSCSMVDYQKEITLMKYNIAIKDFAIYLGLIEEDVGSSQFFNVRGFGIGK